MKIDLRPITAMAAPAERLVVITAETGPVEPGDPDYGGWTVFTYVNPVLALHYFGEEDDLNNTDVYEAVFVTDYGQLVSTRQVHDRCDTRIVHCPWPRKEDKTRLKQAVEDLRGEHRDWIRLLVEKGEPAYHGIDDDAPPRRRRPEPGDAGETNGHS